MAFVEEVGAMRMGVVAKDAVVDVVVDVEVYVEGRCSGLLTLFPIASSDSKVLSFSYYPRSWQV
jgi:hypothetical protein